jgi:hypothetical protein
LIAIAAVSVLLIIIMVSGSSKSCDSGYYVKSGTCELCPTGHICPKGEKMSICPKG